MKKLLYLLIVMMSGVVSGTAVTSCTSDEADEHGSIYGMVSVSGTAEPMRGIGVELYKDDALLLKTVTYDDGHFEFTDLIPGLYELVVEARGYQTAKYKVVVEEGRTARADMQLLRIYNYLTVRTLAATEIKGERATLNGKYSVSDESFKPSEVGFIYSGSSNPQENGTKITSELKESFSTIVSNLKKGKYYYQAYAKNDVGIEYGEIFSFEISGQPSVSTLDPTNVTETSATLNARIDYEGDDKYTERGFVYSASYTNPTIEDPESATTRVEVPGTSIDYSVNIEGLVENTSYHVRAYTINEYGVFYGESVTFIATDKVPYVVIGDIAIQTEDLSSGTTFNIAENLCSISNVGGYTDWRLPTIAELTMMYENRDKIGGFYKDSYWSSTSDTSWGHSNYKYIFNFYTGGSYTEPQGNKYRVRAVRTVK